MVHPTAIATALHIANRLFLARRDLLDLLDTIIAQGTWMALLVPILPDRLSRVAPLPWVDAMAGLLVGVGMIAMFRDLVHLEAVELPT